MGCEEGREGVLKYCSWNEAGNSFHARCNEA
jgi:hypothetical protein